MFGRPAVQLKSPMSKIPTSRTRAHASRLNRLIPLSTIRFRPGSLIGLAVEDDKDAGGKPIDHSRNTYNRGYGGDDIGDDACQAGQELRCLDMPRSQE
jgi:hypothetical protein